MKKLIIVLSFLIGFNFCYAEDPWVKQELSNPYLISKVKFIDPFTGFLMGYNDFLKTTDGGNSWKEILKVPMGGNALVNFEIFNDGYGFIIKAQSTYSITTDFGSKWTDYPLPSKHYYSVLSALDHNRIWLMAGIDKIILFTSDGGNNWDSLTFNNLGNIKYFNDFILLNEHTCLIVTDIGTVLKTTDGGKNWIEKNTEVNKNLYEIDFIDDHNGWLGGQGGTIVRTTDGGETWHTITSPSYNNIVSIYFIDENEGYVSTMISNGLNVSSQIYYTSDGGSSWVFQHQEPNNLITSFSFLNKNVGWAGGGSGILLHLDKTSSVEKNINVMIEKRTVFLSSDKKSYPMPASNNVRTTIYWNGIYNIEDIKINVYTSYGEKISNPEISIEKLASDQATIVWNTGIYASGIYFIHVSLANETISIPIMVNR